MLPLPKGAGVRVGSLLAVIGAFFFSPASAGTATENGFPSLTNLREACPLASQPQNTLCTVDLEGVVAWASRGRDRIILQEGADALAVEVDLRNQPLLELGQRVRLEGKAVAGQGRIRETLIDNDGLHSPTEKSETVFLPAGRWPIEVAWFNGPVTYTLAVEYAGPGFRRQPIPDSALFWNEFDPASRTSQWRRGLEYRDYEGNWRRLPNYRALPAVKSGVTNNFNLDVCSQDRSVGLDFNGYLQIPESGDYTFWLTSDDGSRLSINQTSLQITVVGVGTLPEARRLSPGSPAPVFQRAELAGMLTSVHRYSSGEWEAELSSGTNKIRLELADGTGEAPGLLNWLRVQGLYRKLPQEGGCLLVQDWRQAEVLATNATAIDRPVLKTAEVRKFGAGGQPCVCALHLEGLVLATGPERFLVLQDDTGCILVELMPGETLPRVGQSIILEGTGIAEGVRLRLRNPVLVENDGSHSEREEFGRIFLRAGLHPLHLSWFNLGETPDVKLFYKGPDLPRQEVPAVALFHAEPDEQPQKPRWVPGLAFACYAGKWAWCPDPGLSTPVQEGIASEIGSSWSSRSNEIALEFSGFVDIPREGIYTFWTRSAEGSRLFLDEDFARIRVTGSQPLPAPVHIAPRQFLRDDQNGQWSQVEGVVMFVGEESGSLGLELNTEAGRIHVTVADAARCCRPLLLKSRVRVTGVSQIAYTTEGEKVAGNLVVPGASQIEYLEMAPANWANYPVVSPGDINATNLAEAGEQVIHTRGQLSASPSDGRLIVVEAGKSLYLETTQRPPPTNGIQVEVLGRLAHDGTNLVLQCGYYRERTPASNVGTNVLPLLGSIEQVKSLSREEAERGYPVKIRGVITAPLSGGFFIQDSTWAIYVRWDEGADLTLHAGDYWEVEGRTYAEFAPNVLASRAVWLGPGILPEPLHPTWDQLMNGSLDTRYVELQGIVTKVASDGLILLTHAGKINVQLLDALPSELRPYENALVRLRGCVYPVRNENTQEVESGRIQLWNYSVVVDEPAPADPFAATLKHVAELLLFDSRAGAIQRVKVAGQIIHIQAGEYFLFEKGAGLRFVPQGPVNLKTGDRVEVAGFPELGGPSPVLREAVVRQTGHAPLPVPIELTTENILSAAHEATLVKVAAHLVNVSFGRSEQVLELQAGTRSFVARLDTRRGECSVLPGSQLQLTGVYTGKGGDRTLGRDIDSFELLLDSPGDIVVLQKPGWLTLRRLLAVLGFMAVVLLGSMLWAFTLKRQVDAQTKVIRQKVETEAVLEERARIARDLHDTLEQALVGTSLQLNALAGSLPDLSPTSSRILQIARSMVRHGQAEARRTVRNLRRVEAEKFDLPGALAQLVEQSRCGLPVNLSMRVTGDPRPVSAKVGSHLLRIGQEATTNALKHAAAKNIRMELAYEASALRLRVWDDGCGFDAAHAASSEAGHFGLLGMRERAEKISGRLEIVSAPGQGTLVQVTVALEPPIGPGGET